MTDIRIESPSDPSRARAALAGPIPFGQVLADLMLRIEHDADRGWHQPVVGPLSPIILSPAAKVLHYSLEIFEGHKAYRWPGGEVALFRPELNARRFNRSAERLGMPQIPPELQLEATHLLVDLLREWVPPRPGALYVRPCLIGTEPALGVGTSRTHLYFIVASPVGPYFTAGFADIAVMVEEQQVRAAPGGVGFAKTGGNYAAGIPAQKRAKEAGYDQVLWLDAVEHRHVEELNAMNVFVVQDGELVTPPAGGTILDGITRRSLLELGPELGFPASERPLVMEQLVRDIESGRVSEMMAVGTAAVVTPIGALGYRGRRIEIGRGADVTARPVARALYDRLTGIQYGTDADPHGWMQVVAEKNGQK